MNMIPISEVYNMDCVLGMREYPDKFFDLAICDPEYGINVTKMGLGKGQKKTSFEDKGWDIQRPNIEYFTELFRVSKNQIIWGSNYFMDLMPYPTQCWIIWDKVQEFSGADFEMAWTSFSKPCKAFRKSRVQAHTEDIKIHPTQKPKSLYEWLLKNYAQTGDKILDTHLGSGSSRIAAQKLGFDFYGFEIDKDYFNQSEKRFKDAVSMPLFDSVISVPQQLVLV